MKRNTPGVLYMVKRINPCAAELFVFIISSFEAGMIAYAIQGPAQSLVGGGWS